MPKRSAVYMQDRRIHFCNAATACFRRKGVVNTSLTDICDEARLSMGALYKHFASREELLAAILELRLTRRNTLMAGANWQEFKAALLVVREELNEDPFWRDFQGVADWNESLRALRVREGQAALVQIETLLGGYAKAGEIDPPLDLTRTAHLVSIIIDGSMVTLRSESELHVSLDDLGAYLDLAVGAKAQVQA